MTTMKREDILEKLRRREADLRAREVAHAALFGSRARRCSAPDRLPKLEADRLRYYTVSA